MCISMESMDPTDSMYSMGPMDSMACMDFTPCIAWNLRSAAGISRCVWLEMHCEPSCCSGQGTGVSNKKATNQQLLLRAGYGGHRSVATGGATKQHSATRKMTATRVRGSPGRCVTYSSNAAPHGTQRVSPERSTDI